MEQGIVNVRSSETTCRELDEMLESIKAAAAAAAAAATNHNNNNGSSTDGGASNELSDSVVGRQVDDIRNRFISPVISIHLPFFAIFAKNSKFKIQNSVAGRTQGSR